ncbi:MAG: isocitrate lyase/phosphoenolpyruvate mutase family protein, partial [Chloroflexota bacterium]|nr:isocitrate lyase/phosphoenolpyruvate mutase family protein [Chloroflexota bacterium]
VAPGAADALTARIIERAGFEAVYMTGAGFANAAMAVPDYGLPTMSEVVQHAQRLAEAVRVPLIVDADAGYGNALNVMRPVRELERAGAAAIQLEDQVSPKRCGHFEGKEVVPLGEMLSNIAAAIEARRDANVVLIARTDARAVEGLESAIRRARAYAEAGADVIFVEAPRTLEELRALPAAIPAPLLANMVEGGKTPLLSADDLQAMGYRLVIFANTALRVAARATQEAMCELRDKGGTQGLLDRMLGWDERQQLVGLPEFQELERRFARAEQ